MKAAGAGLRRAARNDGQVGGEERNGTEWEMEACRRSQGGGKRKKNGRQKREERDQTWKTRVERRRQQGEEGDSEYA